MQGTFIRCIVTWLDKKKIESNNRQTVLFSAILLIKSRLKDRYIIKTIHAPVPDIHYCLVQY